MTRSTQAPVPDAITEEAIAWFVRTHSDQRTHADEERLAKWLEESPRHAEAYTRVERVWRAAGAEIRPQTPAAEPHAPRRETNQVVGGWIARVAALFALVVAGATCARHGF